MKDSRSRRIWDGMKPVLVILIVIFFVGVAIYGEENSSYKRERVKEILELHVKPNIPILDTQIYLLRAESLKRGSGSDVLLCDQLLDFSELEKLEMRKELYERAVKEFRLSDAGPTAKVLRMLGFDI